MNKFRTVLLSAALLAGSAGAALAGPMDQNGQSQLSAELQTLQQQQLSAQQCGGNVQAAPPTGFQVQTGG